MKNLRSVSSILMAGMLVLATVTAASAQSQTEPTKAQRYYLRGIEMLQNLKYLDAVEQFHLAIDEDPDYADAFRRLALAYTRMADTDPDYYQDALDAYDELQALLPEEDIDIKKNVAFVQAAMGDLQDAIDTYDEILEMTPEDCSVWEQIGNAQRVQAEREKASAGAENEQYTVRMEKAVAAYNKVTELCPDNLEIYNTLGEIFFRSGELDRAAGVYEALVAKNPEDMDTASRLGYLYQQAEQWDKAVAVYEALLAKQPDRVGDRQFYAKSLQKAKKFGPAADQYQAIIDADPEKKNLYCNMAFLYIDAKDGEKAIETAMRGLAENAPVKGCLNCVWGKGLEYRAEGMLQQGQFDRALTTYGEAKLKFNTALTDANFGSYATKQIERVDQLIERARQMKLKNEQESGR